MSDWRGEFGDDEVDAPAGEPSAAMDAAKSAFPSWEVQQVPPPTDQVGLDAGPPIDPHRHDERGGRRRRGLVVPAILGVLALIGVAGFGYWLGGREADSDVATVSNDDRIAESEPAAPESQDGEAVDGGTSAESEEESDYVAPEIDPGAAFGFESDGVDEQGRPLPVLPDVLIPNTENPAALPFYSADPIDAPSEGPYTVIEQGFFFLRGSLPSEGIRQELIARNLVILPVDQVVIEFTIDPSTSWYFGDPIPVFLLDKLLFDVGSTEINPGFLPLFQIGANLTMLDERVTITVVGHADSRGDADANLALSQARVDAVKAAYVELGANPDQIIAIGKGETEPLADNATAEGRALNRRVEFIVESSEADGVESG